MSKPRASPLSAVASVLVVDASDKIELCEVKVGVDDANDAEVLSGLQEGDQVVVSDRASLTPGEAVHPQPVTPAAYKPKS